MTSNNDDNKDPKKDNKDKFAYMKKAEDWVWYSCIFIFALFIIAFICWALSLGN